MTYNKIKHTMQLGTGSYQSQRNSSVELYRIIATFAVLVVHLNGWFLGGLPESYDIANPTLYRTGQMFICAATVICVNMFVIISGYFGIKLKFRSVVKLYIYLALIYLPLYFIRFIAEHEFILEDFIERCFVISYAGYFIQCYFMLMIVSPILNAFIEKYGKKVLKWVIVFWVLEFWFACIMNVEELGYNRGYSVIHFVLMYMIARCINLYENDIKRIKASIWILCYLLMTLLLVVFYIIGVKWCWDYSNPVVVLSSVFSFLPFLYIVSYNKIINRIASGTLAVYIIHVTNRVHDILANLDVKLLTENSYPMYLIKILGVVVIVFVLSVLYGILCNNVSNRFACKLDNIINGIF